MTVGPPASWLPVVSSFAQLCPPALPCTLITAPKTTGHRQPWTEASDTRSRNMLFLSQVDFLRSSVTVTVTQFPKPALYGRNEVVLGLFPVQSHRSGLIRLEQREHFNVNLDQGRPGQSTRGHPPLREWHLRTGEGERMGQGHCWAYYRADRQQEHPAMCPGYLRTFNCANLPCAIGSCRRQGSVQGSVSQNPCWFWQL